MAFTKTVSDMDDYFKPNNHLKSYTYRKFDIDVQTAAFNQAKRELEVSLGTALVDPDDGDTYRNDYALYEQSLYILENTPRQEVSGIENVIDIADDDKENKKDTVRNGVLISPQASRYLGLNRLKMVRG